MRVLGYSHIGKIKSHVSLGMHKELKRRSPINNEKSYCMADKGGIFKFVYNRIKQSMNRNYNRSRGLSLGPTVSLCIIAYVIAIFTTFLQFVLPILLIKTSSVTIW